MYKTQFVPWFHSTAYAGKVISAIFSVKSEELGLKI